MSAQQKLIASISGSVIGHLLLLVGVFGVLTSSWLPSNPAVRANEKKAEPGEVSVVLADLMEQIEPLPVSLVEKFVRQKQFVNTDSNTAAETKPESARYESDRNTVAAGTLTSDDNLAGKTGPTLRGEERIRALELQNRKFAELRSESRRSAAGEAKEMAGDQAFSDPNSKSEMRVSKTKEEMAANGSLIARRKNRVNGTLSNKKEDAVDAVETPLGRYKKSVIDAVAKKWHQYRKQSAQPVTWGTLRLHFSINPEGKILNLEVTENEGNDLLLDITLKAISEAEFQPMSDEVAAQLGATGLAMKYDVIIY